MYEILGHLVIYHILAYILLVLSLSLSMNMYIWFACWYVFLGAESEFDNSESSGTPTSSISNIGDNVLPPTPLAPRGEPRKRPDSAKGRRGGKKKDRSKFDVNGLISSYCLQASVLIRAALLTNCIIVQEYLLESKNLWCIMWELLLNVPATVAQLDTLSDWRPGGHGFNPCRGRQHSFMEIDREIFSTVILSLPLIQEGQLSVSGERMCTILVYRLED